MDTGWWADWVKGCWMPTRPPSQCFAGVIEFSRLHAGSGLGDAREDGDGRTSSSKPEEVGAIRL